MTATIAILDRQTFERVSFLPISIACCQMLFYMVEAITKTYIENNSTEFQKINRDLKVLVHHEDSVPRNAIGLVWSIV